MKSLEKELKRARKRCKKFKFKPSLITQRVGNVLHISCMWKNEPHYADSLQPYENGVTVYRSMATDEIIGCAIFVRESEIIDISK
jgi:hypothetical protein